MRISDWSSDVCSSDLFHGNLGTHLSLHGSQYLAIIQIHPCAVQPLRLKQVARQRNGGMRRPSNGLYPFDGLGQKIRVALVCISKLMHETNRKSVVEGRSVSYRVYLDCRRSIKK